MGARHRTLVGLASLFLLCVMPVVQPAAAGATAVTKLAALGLQSPEGLAQDALGDLFVTTSDGNTGRIVEFPRAPTGFSSPRTLSYTAKGITGIAVDGSGDIFLSEALPAGGGYLVELAKTSSGYSQPRYLFGIAAEGVAVDKNGDVFVASGQAAIEELPRSNGKFLAPEGIPVPNGGAFAVAADEAGDVYTAVGGTIEEFSKSSTDYSETASFTVRASMVFGLAVGPSGLIYAADDQHNKVIEVAGFGSANPVARTLPLVGLDSPRGIVPLKGDGIAVADLFNDRIVTLTTTGKEESSPLQPGLSGANSIGADSQGNVYVDCSTGVVKIVATRAGYEAPKPLPLSSPLPDEIAVGSQGDLYYVSGTKAFESKLDAGRYGAASRLPLANAGDISAIAVAPSGSILVVVGDQGSAVFELAARSSGYGAESKLPFVGLSYASAVAVDATGDVYVTDRGTERILEVPKAQGRYGSQETLPLKGTSSPDSVAVAPDGDILVAFAGSTEVGIPPEILRLPRAGAGYGRQEELPVPGLNGPTGLAVTPTGVLVVSESDVQLDAAVVAVGKV